MTPEDLHRTEVARRVQSALDRGVKDFQEILVYCEGADPALVEACMASPSSTGATIPKSPATYSRELFVRLPAPNPFRSQWWFTGESVDFLANRAIALVNGGRVLCLGTPTVGHELLSASITTLVLDIDQDVVEAVKSLSSSKEPVAAQYDVADPMPAGLEKSFRLAVIDPPWYESVFRAFLGRALSSLADEGELLCTLPPRLTRPGIDDFRRSVIAELIANGYEVLGLDIGKLAYVVPRFEEVALKRLNAFRPVPWRRADLLHVKKPTTAKPLAIPELDKIRIQGFARSPHEFRVFTRDRASLDPQVTLERLDAYSSSISTRAHAGESPDLWTTEKFGARVGRLDAVKAVLEVWQDLTIRDAAAAVRKLSPSLGSDLAKEVVRVLDEQLGLWTNFASPPPLRTDDEIEERKKSTLSEWATAASAREHTDPSDIFRGAYQRDRDRVLWSRALRRLAHKTQLFPTEHDDQLRQRLAHTIEVMQLASTIGTSFGLDRDLIEAGALAHDIGHAPFGHAGEHALNRLLDQINSNLGGFNHYEHGIDVVRWLESPYATSRTTPFQGLNLTPEVTECILKHTYYHDGGLQSAKKLRDRSKHKSLIPEGYCHLEGQAVRVADKISYFVSDLEDGLRLRAITAADLLSCRFFHRAPLNFAGSSNEILYQKFVEQRRNVLKILMEDILVATNKRLSRTNPERVRVAGEYVVNHSDEILRDMEEVWARLQDGKLHKDRRVKIANFRAARIVSDLSIAFAVCPELVDVDFAAEHRKLRATEYLEHYRSAAGRSVSIQPSLIEILRLERMIGVKHQAGQSANVAVDDLVQAKDFVASLTDSRASSLHVELFEE
jgi:dGTPase